MLKQILMAAFCLFYSAFVLAQVALIDQSSNQVASSVVTQHFEASFSAYTCYGAEDVEVPIGEQWHIDSLILFGEYATPFGNPVTGSGLIVSFHQDNGGAPGTVVFTDTMTSDADADGDGTLLYRWNNPLVLYPGSYWMVVSSRKNYNPGSTQWQWFSATTTVGDTALWTNPGGGFSLINCPSWTPVTSCYGSNNPGQSFALYGCPVAKPMLYGLPDDTSVCSNDNLYLSVGTNAAQPQFFWSSGDTTASINLTSGGVYSITLTDGSSGCSVVDSVTVVENQAPEVALVNQTLCAGDTFYWQLSNPALTSVLWSNGMTSSSMSHTDTGLVWVTATDSNNCMGEDSAFAWYHDQEPIRFLPEDPAYCDGDSVELMLSHSYTQQVWSTGSSLPTAWVSEQGWAYVIVGDSNGCVQEDSVWVEAHPNPSPDITIVFQSGSFMLQANAGYFNYSWSNGATTQEILASMTNYSVTVVDSNGCQGYAEVEVPLGISSDTQHEEVRVFPNPASAQVTIELRNKSDLVEIQIKGLEGRLWMSKSTQDGRAVFQLSHLPRGAYLLIIPSYNFTSTLILN
jgi:hypothetical protein